tara:strand:- start:10411 stop:11037 length:627 start_codon:yes stop_codon:yes gene_type:complete
MKNNLESLHSVSLAAQRGAILIVVLVILMVMTMIGLTSSSNMLSQQQMSVAYQQRSMAGVAAEAALRAAEAYLSNNITSTPRLANFSGNTLGLYSNYTMLGAITNTSPASVSLADVADPDLWDANNSVEVIDYDPSVANPPRYIIEYIGRDKGTANKLAIDYNDPNIAADPKPHVFQITSIGWSRDQGIYSVLQSTFKTGKGGGSFVY